MDRLIAALAVLVFAPLLAFLLYTLFVIAPVSMYAEAKCLRQGYPKAHVTIGLETYCSNLDGTVTVKVQKQ